MQVAATAKRASAHDPPHSQRDIMEAWDRAGQGRHAIARMLQLMQNLPTAHEPSNQINGDFFGQAQHPGERAITLSKGFNLAAVDDFRI